MLLFYLPVGVESRGRVQHVTVEPFDGQLLDRRGRIEEDPEVDTTHLGQGLQERDPFLRRLACRIDRSHNLKCGTIFVAANGDGRVFPLEYFLDLGANGIWCLEQLGRAFRNSRQGDQVG